MRMFSGEKIVLCDIFSVFNGFVCKAGRGGCSDARQQLPSKQTYIKMDDCIHFVQNSGSLRQVLLRVTRASFCFSPGWFLWRLAWFIFETLAGNVFGFGRFET